MSNSKNTVKSSMSAKVRVVLAVVIAAALAGGVAYFIHHKYSQSINRATVKVSKAPRIASLPGAGNPSNQYVKDQNVANARGEEEARKHAKSYVPTITRPNFVGNPSAFGQSNLNMPAHPIRECPIKKVVVMYKPNPASCSLRNLVMARRTGVTAEELMCQGCSCPVLKDAGYTAGDLKDIGYSAKQLRGCGFTVAQLAEAGFDAAQLKAAGFTAKQLANAGFTPGQLAAAGFSAAQLKAAGFTAKQLKAAGFTPAQLSKAGFTAKQLKGAGFTAAQLRKAGFSNAALKAAGFTPAQIKAADAAIISKVCNVTALKKARMKGASAASLRQRGCGLAALKAAGFTAAQLKNAGFSAGQLKAAGFTAAQLKNAGFTAAQLKKAGFNAKQLKSAGFSAAALKQAGFTAGQLRHAGFNAIQLKNAGFSAKQLRNAGFGTAALKAAGFTPKQLEAAGFTKGDLLRAGFTPTQAGYAPMVQPKTAAVSASRAPLASGTRTNTTGASASMPSITSNSPEAQLARLEKAQQARMDQQQRIDAVQQAQSAMTMQAQKLLAGWSNNNSQSLNRAPEAPKVTGAEAGKGSGKAPFDGRIIKAGTVMFAVLETSIDSDSKSPIMARIVQGPLKGSVLLGQFTRTNTRLLLNFNLLNDPHLPSSVSMNAVAIDPDTARTALSGQVNMHYLLRYGTLFASAFLQGLSSAIMSSGSTQNCFFGFCQTTTQNLSLGQQAAVGLGTVGEKYSQVMGQNFNRPPTVKIAGGTGIGILLMSDLKLPNPAPTLPNN